MALVLNGSNDTITGLQINSANIVNGSIVNDDINASAAIASTKISGGVGKILQVLQVTKNDVTSQSSGGVTTFYDISGLTLNITPASASNKILIRFVVNFGCSNGDSNGLIRLQKNGSIITAFHGADGTVANGANFTRFPSQWQISPFNNEFLDTAGGTSAITYKLQWSTESGRTIYLNRRGGSAEYGTVSYLTLMEVAA